MTTRPRLLVLVAAASLGAGAGTASAGVAAGPPPCTGKALTGTFRVVPGSAGAGNITYALRLRNSSQATCFVTGIPGLTLLDGAGRRLPTQQAPAHPGQLTAVMVRLAPGRAAVASARFSPDVPGPGETTTRACERTAYKLRVAPSGGGTLAAPITPPTPVCEHGAMTLSVLTAG
jgi:hypothetical protein